MMKTNITRITCGFALLMGACSSSATPLQSGVYEGLQLAVSPGGKIAGYYSESAEDSVKRTCTFFLAGEVSAQQPDTITSWSSSVLAGHIAVNNSGVTLTIPDGQSHAGCMNVLMPEIATGLELETTQKTRWQTLMQVTSSRAYLSATPDIATRRKAWIVKGDVVGVIQTQGNWKEIEYVGDRRKTTHGWVNSNDVQPLTPPAS
ncbi:hypothetical protein ACN5L5_003922 [Cronobacter turicensis]|uniref:hypothetical protein n=1 Tax=Cronobacter turicensis TaxID=413502 RepID=UPI001FB747DC|nr:hypothetical protein [Cronobacter turicensis]